MRCRNCGSEKIVIDRSLNGRHACSVCGSTDIDPLDYGRSQRDSKIVSYILVYDKGTDEEGWYNAGDDKKVIIPIFKNSLDAVAHSQAIRKAGLGNPLAKEFYTSEVKAIIKENGWEAIYIKPGNLSQLPKYEQADNPATSDTDNSDTSIDSTTDHDPVGLILALFTIFVSGGVFLFMFQSCSKKFQSFLTTATAGDQRSDSSVNNQQTTQNVRLSSDKPYHFNFEQINSPFEVLEYLYHSGLDIQTCPKPYTWMDNLGVDNYHEYCGIDWENHGKMVNKPVLEKIAEDQSLPYIQFLSKKCKLNPAQSNDVPMNRPGQSADSTAAFIFQGGLDSIIDNKGLEESMLKHSSSSLDKSNICNHLNAPGARDYIKELYTTRISRPGDNPKYFALTIPAELLENALIGKQYRVYGRLENRTDGNIWVSFHGSSHITKTSKYISLDLANELTNRKF